MPLTLTSTAFGRTARFPRDLHLRRRRHLAGARLVPAARGHQEPRPDRRRPRRARPGRAEDDLGPLGAYDIPPTPAACPKAGARCRPARAKA